MRRPAVLAAAAAASVISVGLIAPAAQAAPTPTSGRLVATATCDEGQARLVSRVGRSGTQRAHVTVTGVTSTQWRGGLVLDPYDAFAADSGSDPSSGDMSGLLGGPAKHFVAAHGHFASSAKLRDSRSLDAVASFTSASLTLCTVGVISHAGQYAVTAGLGDGLLVRTGRDATVQAIMAAESHHRYRLAFTVRTRAGVQHRTVTRTAGSLGVLRYVVSDFKGLSGFTQASVEMTDLTVRVPVERYSLAR